MHTARVFMRDSLSIVGLVVAFATFVTVHLAIAVGLVFRFPRWRAPVALVVPPLAAYWALRGGMRVRGALWLGSLLLYAVFLGLASR